MAYHAEYVDRGRGVKAVRLVEALDAYVFADVDGAGRVPDSEQTAALESWSDADWSALAAIAQEMCGATVNPPSPATRSRVLARLDTRISQPTN